MPSSATRSSRRRRSRKPPDCTRIEFMRVEPATREPTMKRHVLMLLSALAMGACGPVVAQDKYPSKPVKVLVRYAPGGATDITTRLFGEQLKNILGQQFVV